MSHRPLFDIRIVSPEPEAQPEGWPALRGELRLGEAREGFRAPLGPWTAADYERQWRAAATRLLAGEPAGFWTVPWQFWWVAWPEGEHVVFQEHFLAPERLVALGHVTTPAAGAGPHEMIGPRESHTEEGECVSEWQVPLSAVRAWLAGQPAAPANS
jgi:hypothetical protein